MSAPRLNPLSAYNRALRVCETMEKLMRQQGLVTTLHYECGMPLIAGEIKALLDEIELLGDQADVCTSDITGTICKTCRCAKGSAS